MSSFIFQVLDVEPEWTVTYEEVLDYLKGAYSKMVSTLKYDHLSCIQSVRVIESVTNQRLRSINLYRSHQQTINLHRGGSRGAD